MNDMRNGRTMTMTETYGYGGMIERVAADIGAAITGGRIRPGGQLPSERSLAARYGVTTPVIREALHALEHRGLIVRMGPRLHGWFACRNQHADAGRSAAYPLGDLVEARARIGVSAAGLAAARCTDAQLHRVHLVYERMIAEPDARRWLELYLAFHAEIADASGSPLLGDVLAGIHEAVAGDPALCRSIGAARAEAEQEHAEILRALARRSSDDAERWMRRHLDRASEAAVSVRRAA